MGIDQLIIMNIGISLLEKFNSIDYYWNGIFHCSHIKGKKVFDFGFLITGDGSRMLDEDLEQFISEDIIDLNYIDEKDYTVGCNPKTLENWNYKKLTFFENSTVC